MTEHLSTQMLEQYRRRVMSAPDLLAADDHLAACEDCRQLARASLHMESVISGLRLKMRSEVVGLESDHPTYEQIVALVDGKIDERSREALETHLELCAPCAEDVSDLRIVRSEVLASSLQKKEPAPTLRQKFASFTNSIRLPLRPAFTAALAILVVSASVALFFAWRATRLGESSRRAAQTELPRPAGEVSPTSGTGKQANVDVAPASPPQPNVNADDTQIVVTLNDGDGRVTLDTRGNIVGLVSLSQPSRQAIKRALTTGSVAVPPGLSELRGTKGTLLGKTGDAAFSLVRPLATITRTAQPTFRWRPLSGATSYTVAVLDPSFNVVANSPSLTRTSWTPPRPLERGRVYSWQVTAVKDGKEIISPAAPAPEARFKVLEKAKADELREVERVGESHLARGILYARAGLLDDAERELRLVLAANPNSPTARKLLQSVLQMRTR